MLLSIRRPTHSGVSHNHAYSFDVAYSGASHLRLPHISERVFIPYCASVASVSRGILPRWSECLTICRINPWCLHHRVHHNIVCIAVYVPVHNVHIAQSRPAYIAVTSVVYIVCLAIHCPTLPVCIVICPRYGIIYEPRYHRRYRLSAHRA
jgi:hypothetical protein